MLNLVLFGPPGAGKGTQSNLLIDKYNLVHLSTGDILRREIVTETALGLKAKSLMDRGDLVPDEVVIGMISSKLDNNPDSNGFIFDGFPRTTNQAISLDNFLNSIGSEVSLMLALEVEDKELIARLLNRGKESGREDDKNESIIANRINVYNEQTAIVAEHYESQNKFVSVNGIGSIDEITSRLYAIIDN